MCRYRCGYEFCYMCGEEWKTCACTQWSEDNLQAVLAVENAQEPGPHQHDWYEVFDRCDECWRRRPYYRCRDCPVTDCPGCRAREAEYYLELEHWHLHQCSESDGQISLLLDAAAALPLASVTFRLTYYHSMTLEYFYAAPLEIIFGLSSSCAQVPLDR